MPILQSLSILATAIPLALADTPKLTAHFECARSLVGKVKHGLFALSADHVAIPKTAVDSKTRETHFLEGFYVLSKDSVAFHKFPETAIFDGNYYLELVGLSASPLYVTYGYKSRTAPVVKLTPSRLPEKSDIYQRALPAKLNVQRLEAEVKKELAARISGLSQSLSPTDDLRAILASLGACEKETLDKTIVGAAKAERLRLTALASAPQVLSDSDMKAVPSNKNDASPPSFSPSRQSVER